MKIDIDHIMIVVIWVLTVIVCLINAFLVVFYEVCK